MYWKEETARGHCRFEVDYPPLNRGTDEQRSKGMGAKNIVKKRHSSVSVRIFNRSGASK
jgi:hypothetical protein